jgi:TonB family protein
MYKLILFAFIVLSFCSNAQISRKYYDRNWKSTTVKDSAKYYRDVDTTKSIPHGKIADYYISGKIQMEGNYVDGKKEGDFAYYFENGKISSFGLMENDEKTGTWELHYINGTIKEKGKYIEAGFSNGRKQFNYKMDSYFDSTGTQLVNEGDGIYVRHYENGKRSLEGTYKEGYKSGIWQKFNKIGLPLYIEKYEAGILISGKSFDEYREEFEYNKIEIQPEFKGGMSALAKYLQENIKYPKKAKNLEIEGKVFVEFYVNKEGEVGEVKIKLGVHDLLNNEALRVVSLMPAWTPGQLRGQPAKVRFILPIKFTLTNK